MATYEDEYKLAVERQKQGNFTGLSPTEIDKKYGRYTPPTVDDKYKAIDNYRSNELQKVNSGYYDNPDNRRQWLSPNEQKLYDSGNLKDYFSQSTQGPSKYDDWNAYFSQQDVAQGMNNSDTALSSGGSSRGTYNPSSRQAMSYGEASDRAKQQLDPLYERALENVYKQRYQNELNASEVASKRGLSHSGLAADQMNKIGLATQSNVSDLDAQRAAKTAEMAQRMVEYDQNMALQERAAALSEYLGVEGLNLNREQFDFGKFTNQRDFDYNRSRDLIGDQRYNQQFDYQRALDERNFGYQQSRDARRDAEWESEQKDARAWRQYVFNNMSASEKAQLEWAKAQYGEEAAWRMYEMEYRGNLDQAMNQAMIDYYQNAGFNTEVKGDGWIPNTKDYKITSQYGGRADPFTGKQDSHRGVDLAVPKGTSLASTVSGKVVSTSGHSSYGNTVVIQDANGFLHRYAHLDSVNVKVGQEVSRGSFIGKSGNSGRSTGAHLHYEVTNSKGGLVDPSRFLK
ncbi:M23 family metallopeptidase [Bacillus sp. DTU_2020_1000418_1_SI_GHA_SEK_038]|uniref:M23 family metallopeptidase n=1 Tax=Bacillus sp. DTU_2020_1000418_1_SI_GHA_SEK_038 TaxID=3077585 RepID=UPI0028E8200E|nr:M23 family metallopeptidase [Bacillus sp. DTU_2020_1000418_1_SI_GHA_SEK_038]WNS74231.1 M23 family metallopeptidase [Bacillus sp. DTU_2020_1000418_1_SI_GHA_SEK_038]